MFSTIKHRLFKPAGVAQFIVAIAALVALPAPAFTQSIFAGVHCTYTQGGWGAVPSGNNPGSILANNFSSVYPNPSGVEVGIPGASGFSMMFTNAPAIEKYLPAGGKANALTGDLTNPTTSPSGVFGGQVLALELNVDFSDAGKIGDGLAPAFGDLIFFDLNTSFDGMTVRDVLAAANIALGGGALPTDYSIRGSVTGTANLNDLVSFLNQGFDNCNPSDFVKQHLKEEAEVPLPCEGPC